MINAEEVTFFGGGKAYLIKLIGICVSLSIFLDRERSSFRIFLLADWLLISVLFIWSSFLSIFCKEVSLFQCSLVLISYVSFLESMSLD